MIKLKIIPTELEDDIEVEEMEVEIQIIPQEEEEEEKVEDKEEKLTNDGEDSDLIEIKEEENKIEKNKKIDFSSRRIPIVGQNFKALHFLITIEKKIGKVYFCKILWSELPCSYRIGEILEIKEIAFYSEYYILCRK